MLSFKSEVQEWWSSGEGHCSGKLESHCSVYDMTGGFVFLFFEQLIHFFHPILWQYWIFNLFWLLFHHFGDSWLSVVGVFDVHHLLCLKAAACHLVKSFENVFSFGCSIWQNDIVSTVDYGTWNVRHISSASLWRISHWLKHMRWSHDWLSSEVGFLDHVFLSRKDFLSRNFMV